MEWFATLFLYFSFMAFGGWVLEVIFRSIQQKRLVNPGFLQGPFVAVYGFGGISIYFVTQLLPPQQWGVWTWVAVILMPSVVEYMAGWMTEKFFHLKLWDYSSSFLHLQGRVCLKFSVLWGILAVGTVVWLQPFLFGVIEKLPLAWRWLLTGWLSMYLTVDFWFSARIYQRYAGWLVHLKENLTQLTDGTKIPSLSLKDTHRYFLRLFQPLHAFPHLAQQLRKRITEFPESFRDFLSHFLPKD